MILTQRDIDEFHDSVQTLHADDGEDAFQRFFLWLSENPQVLMTAPFQEFVSAHEFPLFRRLREARAVEPYPRPLFRDFNGAWVLPFFATASREPWMGYRLEALHASQDRLHELAATATAIWKDYRHATDHGDYVNARDFKEQHDSILLESNRLHEKCEIKLSTFDEILGIASKYVDNPLADSTLLVSSRFWTPGAQSDEKELLHASVSDLVIAIQREEKELESISWQQFEEVVAEVFRAKGMSIHLVTESPQGGRDIIARFPFGPSGEMATLAIEVKHKDVVDRPTLQQSLFQNRGFAGLMLVTSGRFTSGVIEEAAKPEHRMRVFLKDGVAIRDLIGAYRLESK